MRCPSCNAEDFDHRSRCGACGFQGSPDLILTLSHVDWLLDELARWRAAGTTDLTEIRRSYRNRRRELQVELGLRPAPLGRDAAREVWPELYRQASYRDSLRAWREAGLLKQAVADRLIELLDREIAQARARIDHLQVFDFVLTDRARLRITNELLARARGLRQADAFASVEAADRALAPLVEEQRRLKVRLGLVPPEPRPEPAAQPATPASDAQAPAGAAELGDAEKVPAPAPPPVPRPPLRERLVHTLLSERTLHAILFLGIFLLFSAAVTFVIWGWKDFSPPLRVAIPAGFTVTFFAMGWYLRARTTLTESGVALAAIAALLIPIDFYTAYVNLDLMPGRWAEFWLLTSLICLAAYVVVALRLQSPFFGYLVATAAGSVVLAAIEVGAQTGALSRDWYPAGLSALSMVLTVLAAYLERRRTRWRVYAQAFRTYALLMAGVVMALAAGWRYVERGRYDTLHRSMVVAWWIGGLLLGWGAALHRSWTLGLISAIALPSAVYMTQADLFHYLNINGAWHALGWAALTPLYVLAGRWTATHEDETLRALGRTVNLALILLMVVAAFWSLTDLTGSTAAAASHGALIGAVALAAVVWQRPAYLYGASALSLTAASFGMTELALTVGQLGVGWASLAILHLILALQLRRRAASTATDYLTPVVRGGYAIAALAVLVPLFPYKSDLAIYTLGNWIALTGWGAYLADTGRWPFSPKPKAIFHWLAALPLPFWLWMVFTQPRPADVSIALALAALAWGMVALSYRLRAENEAYRWPWYVTGLAVGVGAVVVALIVDLSGFGPPLTLLSLGALAFWDAVADRRSPELAPAGLIMAVGLVILLDRLNVSVDAAALGLSLLIAAYILGGLAAERWRAFDRPREFLQPLYVVAHLLVFVVLSTVYERPYAAYTTLYPGAEWTDTMKLWGAASQLVLGVVYGLFAWGTYQEGWAHAAAWLGAAGGGFIFIAYSQGRGSSAAKVAVLAAVFVLAERALHRLQEERRVRRRRRAFFRLAWALYRRPLLVAGWSMSGAAVGLAFLRNLWLLGGGRTRRLWAIAGLIITTALYAWAARLFRRAIFVWLAAYLVIGPWTLLTDLGWFTPYRLTVPGFAAGWAILAWLLYLTGREVTRLAGDRYGLPLKVVSHLLLAFSLLWGVADAETSRVTFGLAVALYGLCARLDYRRLRAGELNAGRASTWLYPALLLAPVWCVYLLAWYVPAARHEHHGLMLLAFGPVGLATGEVLRRVVGAHELKRMIDSNRAPLVFPPDGGKTGSPAPRRYALPAYLTGYIALTVGTLLVAHLPTLLVMVLLYDALLMLASARIFREPLWSYPTAVLIPIALLIALNQGDVLVERHGWWLLGLGVVYLALGRLLRGVRLPAYANAALTAGFALAALSLPASSQDRTGAIWGYGGAALVYAVTAFRLRQPLLLTAAAGLVVVPYALLLGESALDRVYHGLALLPGAVVALALATRLDRVYGARRDFPWQRPGRWLQAVTARFFSWWALPLYLLGFGLAAAAPAFTAGRADLSALNLALLVPICGWALHRFRLRGWLLALGLAAQLAVARYLDFLGWWSYPAYAWLRFAPATVVTVLAALGIERAREEPPPTKLRYLFRGWSRPLYALALTDVVLAQLFSVNGTNAAAQVTLIHTLILALLASVWSSPAVAAVALGLGVPALGNQLAYVQRPWIEVPVAFARLALGYGLIGFGIALVQQRAARLPRWVKSWERPAQVTSLALSLLVLGLAMILGIDLSAWTLRVLLAMPFREIVDVAVVQMVVGVLALLGLLYVGAAVAYRVLRLGYVAVGMLLLSWTLHAFYVQAWSGAARIQWYAVPAGLYLLAISALEWARDHKTLSRWLDYAALLLMMGSLFWQTLLFGWNYALMLGAEGLLALWWGSARRLRRFLYGGMVGVILATLGQLIHSLQSVLQWIIVSVIVGLALFAVGAFVERNLGRLKVSLQEALETWE